MTPESQSLPGPEFKPADIDRIAAAYSKPVDPERKEAILATLRGQRAAFQQSRSPAKTERPPRSSERE